MITGIDLFSGAGGLSCGMSAAGVEILAAVEADPHAARTHQANHPDCLMLQRELVMGDRLLDELPARPDLIAGGPPCQGWSTLGSRGSSKLREKYNSGIHIFLDQVKSLEPSAVLLENVLGLARADGGKRLEQIIIELDQMGYDARADILSAQDHDVPQLRRRVFVSAIRKELGPLPAAPQASISSPTVADAISDLPILAAGEAATTYTKKPISDLAIELRGGSQVLDWHQAPDHSPEIMAMLASLPKEGGSRGDIKSDIAPRSGFHNTYGRLRSDLPANAVTGSIGRVSSGRHVHPQQNRALTPREAARLQTFPDNYEFLGHRWSVYKQIGNAVPPRLAEAVLSPLVTQLEDALAASRLLTT